MKDTIQVTLECGCVVVMNVEDINNETQVKGSVIAVACDEHVEGEEHTIERIQEV